MMDERFSSQAFSSCGLDSREARQLADLLADEIRLEVHEVLDQYMRVLIERLNAMGHNLKLETSYQGDTSYPGDISYRDDWEDSSGYHCELRLAINTIVTDGYAHFISRDEALSPIST